jgi:3-hydroxyisobutyrate dehydrogenase-like beta-hydroxyacid dehydrogenase
MAAFEATGAKACSSPGLAVQDVPLVISSLMDDASVRAVANEIFAKMAPNAIHLCVTTISPTCADWLAEEHPKHGSRYVSGPVIGRPDAAAQGTLVELLAGDAGAIEEVRPVRLISRSCA